MTAKAPLPEITQELADELAELCPLDLARAHLQSTRAARALAPSEYSLHEVMEIYRLRYAARGLHVDFANTMLVIMMNMQAYVDAHPSDLEAAAGLAYMKAQHWQAMVDREFAAIMVKEFPDSID